MILGVAMLFLSTQISSNNAAYAADILGVEMTPLATEEGSFSGRYVGLGIGYVDSTFDRVGSSDSGVLDFGEFLGDPVGHIDFGQSIEAGNHSGDSMAVQALIIAQRQFGRLVIGVEASGTAFDINSEQACGDATAQLHQRHHHTDGEPLRSHARPETAELTCEAESVFAANVLGRVGYAVGNFMPYVTGGGGYQRMSYKIGVDASPIPGVPVLQSASQNFDLTGWSYGAGLMLKAGAFNLDFQYLRTDFGNVNLKVDGDVIANIDTKTDQFMARAVIPLH